MSPPTTPILATGCHPHVCLQLGATGRLPVLDRIRAQTGELTTGSGLEFSTHGAPVRALILLACA